MRIGITGGIGSGKSYVCKHLKCRGIEVYDCDSAAKRLMRESEELRQQLTDLIGANAYKNGKLNKPAIARFLLDSEENAHALDAIVHPAVFRDFENSKMQWMESAIMYESGIYRLVDRVIVVTAPLEVRIQRIIARDRINREKAMEWVERQWPQDVILQRADFEIVNDGKTLIDPQLDHILPLLHI
jgi:dephospho-CoA kinase